MGGLENLKVLGDLGGAGGRGTGAVGGLEDVGMPGVAPDGAATLRVLLPRGENQLMTLSHGEEPLCLRVDGVLVRLLAWLDSGDGPFSDWTDDVPGDAVFRWFCHWEASTVLPATLDCTGEPKPRLGGPPSWPALQWTGVGDEHVSARGAGATAATCVWGSWGRTLEERISAALISASRGG